MVRLSDGRRMLTEKRVEEPPLEGLSTKVLSTSHLLLIQNAKPDFQLHLKLAHLPSLY